MPNSELDNIDLNQELEFNNGVGDALKQREEYMFSWKKTAIVLSAGVVIIVLITFGILEIGKSLLSLNKQNVDDIPIDPIVITEPIQEPKDDSKWDVLPEDADDSVNKSDGPNIQQKAVDSPISDTFPKPIKEIVAKKANVQNVKEKPAKKISSPARQINQSSVVYRVIAGSFTNYNNAQKELERLTSQGYTGYIWSLTSPENKVSYKVQLGAFKSMSSAQRLVSQLKKRNVDAYISKH